MWTVALATLLVLQAPATTPADQAPKVVITQPDESKFPEITVYFELRKPDGTFIRDAKQSEFKLMEDGQERPILGFDSPVTLVTKPTTIVLVLDRSGSMLQHGKITALKRAVGSFLDDLPQGSRVAVIAFGSQIRVACPFTTDIEEVRSSVDRITPGGATRYFDAVGEALKLLGDESGRRAVLAMTDGLDTDSKRPVEDVVAAAQRLGVPVHTLGLGEGDEIDTESLNKLAEGTRGQSYRAKDAEGLKAIYQELADRLGSTYSLQYQTDRKVPDGTLRPIKLFYAEAKEVGESAVFIRGMVVPAPGWSRLFLVLVVSLSALAALPSFWKNTQSGKSAKHLMENGR